MSTETRDEAQHEATAGQSPLSQGGLSELEGLSERELSAQLQRLGLSERRFHVVTGKGGVGKSTVSVALGLALSRLGKRVLICEVDEREQLTNSFGLPPSAGALVPLCPQRPQGGSLWGVNITLNHALSEYGALKLKVRALSQLLTDHPLTRALMALIPGVGDLVFFGKAFNHEREQQGGRPTWDVVILDAPATGHGLTFLSLPKLISELVPVGNIKREADEMWALISDPLRSALHVVTTAEELPLREARELCEHLTAQLQLKVSTLWLNQAPHTTPLTPLMEALEALLQRHPQLSDLSLAPLYALARAQEEATPHAHGSEALAREVSASLLSLPKLKARAPSSHAQGELLSQDKEAPLSASAHPQPLKLINTNPNSSAHPQLLTLVGAGGVGKTSLSAALALAHAQAGSRVALITIDPARRLAQALGLSELSGVLERVTLQTHEAHKTHKTHEALKGELWAMSLERSVTAERLVERYAPSPELASKLKAHPYFQAFSTSLSGAQEYMAIYEVSSAAQSGRFDVIVLDTPPGRHALDFLDAPARLSRSVNHPALSLFLKARDATPSRAGVLSSVGKGLVLKAFSALTSTAFVGDLGSFLQLFIEVLRGLEREGAALLALSQRAEFYLVSTLQAEPLRVASLAHLALKARGLSVSGLLLNRCPEALSAETTALLERAQALTQALTHPLQEPPPETEGQHKEQRARLITLLEGLLEELSGARAEALGHLSHLTSVEVSLSALPQRQLAEVSEAEPLETVLTLAQLLAQPTQPTQLTQPTQSTVAPAQLP